MSKLALLELVVAVAVDLLVVAAAPPRVVNADADDVVGSAVDVDGSAFDDDVGFSSIMMSF